MALTPPLDRIPKLYHFTDSRNLPSIRDRKAIYSMAKLRSFDLDVHFPGGNEWSLTADIGCGMNEYVHLCFRNQHPMEYRAKNDGQIERTAWLEIDPSVLERPGVLFCPGISNKAGMTTHSLAEAAEMIDFDVLYTRLDWKDPQVRERLHDAERYEFLIPDLIPIKYVTERQSNG